jgi:hypothetical protein
MAPTRVITKRLYRHKNCGNQNVSLDWTNAYNSNPYGATWTPPMMRVDLIAPNTEPTLYSAQSYGGSTSGAVFINPVDIIYQPVGGSTTPYPLLGAQGNNWGNIGGFGYGYGANNSYFNSFYGSGYGFNTDFNSINAM